MPASTASQHETATPSPRAHNMSAADMKLYLETLEFERIFGIVVPSIFSLVILVGLIGNILVILVVLRNHQMQNSTNTLILSLAISDLLFIIFCVPFTAADYALPIWIFSRMWCKVVTYLQQVAAYATVWTLVLMAFDRCLAVVLPVQSMTLRTCRNTITVVMCVWLLCCLANVPLIWETDIFAYRFVEEQRSVCAFMKSATRNGTSAEVRGLYFSFNAFGYVIPLLITLVLYAFMLHKLWYRMPMSAAGRRVSEEANRAKRRVAKMVTTVTVTFAVCWLPLNICFFITGVEYAQFKPPQLTQGFLIFQVFAQILAYTNSCVNPILYAFLSENFRRGFYYLFLKWGFLYGRSDRYNSFRFERTDIRSQQKRGSTAFPTVSFSPYRQNLDTTNLMDIRRFSYPDRLPTPTLEPNGIIKVNDSCERLIPGHKRPSLYDPKKRITSAYELTKI